MKKSMESAYTDMMNNLAKSTAAIPLHLQGAKGALAWWEQPDSLLAKSEIAPAGEDLAKASAENETDEAYEEDEKKDAEKKAKKEPEEKEDADETEESDEDPEPAEEGMKKALNMGGAVAAAVGLGKQAIKKVSVMAGKKAPTEQSPTTTDQGPMRMGALAQIEAENKRKAALVNEAAGIVRGMNETYRTKVLGKALAELDALADSMLAKKIQD